MSKILESIITSVSVNYGLDITEPTRKTEHVAGRTTYYMIAREKTDLSLEKIGNQVGKDHASVINALKKAKGLFLSYPTLGKIHSTLINRFNAFESISIEAQLIDETIQQQQAKILSLQDEIMNLNDTIEKLKKNPKENDLTALIKEIPPRSREAVKTRLKAIITIEKLKDERQRTTEKTN